MSHDQVPESRNQPSRWRAAGVAALSMAAGVVLVGVGLAVSFEANAFTGPRGGPRGGYLALLGLAGLAALVAPPLAARLFLCRVPSWSVAIVLVGAAFAAVIVGIGGV